MSSNARFALPLSGCIVLAILASSCVRIVPVQEQCGLRYEKLGKATCLKALTAGGPQDLEERQINKRYQARYQAALQRRIQKAGTVPAACAQVNQDLAKIPDGPGRSFVRKTYGLQFKSMMETLAADSNRCNVRALCALPNPDKCTRKVYSACTEHLASEFRTMFEADKSCEAPAILDEASQQMACMLPFTNDRGRAAMEKSIQQHKLCICGKGNQLMTDLVGGQTQLVGQIPDILNLMGLCPAEQKATLDGAQKKSFTSVMENALYVIEGVDLAGFSREMNRFQVPYEKARVKALLRLLRRRKSVPKLHLEALNHLSTHTAFADTKLLPAFESSMCVWAMAAVQPTAGISGDGAQKLAGHCAARYEKWVKALAVQSVRAMKYDQFKSLVDVRIAGTAVEQKPWYTKLAAKVARDIEKSRANLVAHKDRCGKGKAASAKAIAKTRDYGVIIEEKAQALEHCLTAYDDFYGPKVAAALDKDCRRGLNVLLSAIGNSRGGPAKKALAALIKKVGADDGQFEAELGTALGGPVTPALKDAAVQTFRCACAEHCLGMAQKSLRKKDAVEALKAIRKANLRRHLKKADGLTGKGIKMLRASLFQKATDAFKRSLPGVGTLYVSIMDELFPAPEAKRDKLREELAAALTSTIDLNRSLQLAGLRRGGQMSAQLGGQLGGLYRCTPDAVSGTAITFQPKKLEASWKTKRGHVQKVHKHIVETQVKNEEKYEACDELPQAQSDLASAEQAMKAAQRLCKAAADRAARAARSAHWLLGAVTKVAGGAACNIAAEKLLIEKAREKRDTLQYNCHELPPMVTKAVEKEYKFRANTHDWNYVVEHKVEVKNALGEVVCTVEQNKTDHMKDISYRGNPNKDLPADSLQEPDHKQHVRGMFGEVMDASMDKVDRCIEDRLEDFVRATTVAAQLKAGEEELVLETRVRMKAAPHQSVPVYSDLTDIAQESMPVSWLRETIEAMPQQ